MPNAVILSIGNELLRGRTVDTNFTWLARKLYTLGIQVQIHYTVPDTEEWVCASLSGAVERADIIITTGGLGPTGDDHTRKGLSRFLERKLIFNQRIAKKIRQYFDNRGIEMPESNLVQAYLPKDAVPLENNEGTAPGIFAKYDSKLIFLLPGPPNEMKDVFRSVELILKKEIDLQVKESRVFRTIGVPESLLSEWIDELDISEEVEIAFYPAFGAVDIFISTQKEKLESLQSTEHTLLRKLNPYIYADNENRRIEAVVGELLRERNETIAFAESCTGGMLSSAIVDIPGSSDYFSGGIISYSNQAKQKLLGVNASNIHKYGAVSPQVAKQMADGIRQKFSTSYGIGITGIAGPTGETENKPVGLVYIAVATPENIFVRKYNFTGGRDSVRNRTKVAALNILWCQLKFDNILHYPFQDGGSFI
ncbi:competence/damage-inducible protein A, partial [bacterium]